MAEFLNLYADLSIPILLVGILSVLVIAVSKAGFGGAMGALSAPIMLFVLPPKMALAVLLPLFLLSDVWAVLLWRKYGVFRIILAMGAFGIVGQLIGWAVFDYINDEMLAFLIGLVAVSVAVQYGYQHLRAHSGKQSSDNSQIMINAKRKSFRKRFIKRAAYWMSLSGFSSFVSLTGGIPAQIYLAPLRLPRKLFIGSMCWYFLIVNMAKVPFFTELDMFTPQSLALTVLFLPVVPVGIFMGKWLVLHLSDRLFYHFIHIALFVIGLRLIITFGPQLFP